MCARTRRQPYCFFSVKFTAIDRICFFFFIFPPFSETGNAAAAAAYNACFVLFFFLLLHRTVSRREKKKKTRSAFVLSSFARTHVLCKSLISHDLWSPSINPRASTRRRRRRRRRVCSRVRSVVRGETASGRGRTTTDGIRTCRADNDDARTAARDFGEGVEGGQRE